LIIEYYLKVLSFPCPLFLVPCPFHYYFIVNPKERIKIDLASIKPFNMYNQTKSDLFDPREKQLSEDVEKLSAEDVDQLDTDDDDTANVENENEEDIEDEM